MNLLKIFLRRTPTADAPSGKGIPDEYTAPGGGVGEPAAGAGDSLAPPPFRLAKVVNLHGASDPTPFVEQGQSAVEADRPGSADSSSTRQRCALLDEPELRDFFGRNYYGFGRHNGSLRPSRDVLEGELDALCAQFQTLLLTLAARRRSRLDEIEQHAIEVQGLSSTISARLELAAEHRARDLGVIAEQVRLAGERKGWVLDAINRFRLGFDRGAHEALSFEKIYR